MRIAGLDNDNLGKPIDLIPPGEFPAGATGPVNWSLALGGDHIPGYSRSDWIEFHENARGGGDYSHWDSDSFL
jgi:hypothetical protein